MIVANLDDYHNIHTHQRPNEEKASTATHMVTAVFRIFNEIRAIEFTDSKVIHNPQGVDSDLCIEFIAGLENMYSYRHTFASTMSPWLRECFFDPKMVKQRLNAHEYQQSENVQKPRSMDNLYLLEFKELSLKNYKGFEDGIKFFTESKFSKYLKRLLVIFPGDHPMQFFSRQIIYTHTCNGNQNTPDVQQALSSNCSSNVENSQLNNDKLFSYTYTNPS